MKKDSEVRIQALRTIDILCDDLKLTEFSSRIVHAIARTIDNNATDKKVVSAAMDTLIKFTYQMGRQYEIYIPLMEKILAKHKLQFPMYEQLVADIRAGVDIEEMDVESLISVSAANGNRRLMARRARETREQQQQAPTTDAKRTTTLEEIRQSWADGARRISKEDWLEWLRKFNIDLIKESPSLALRSCYPIAQASNAVARDLFNPAFLTCWNELNPEQQKVTNYLFVLKEPSLIMYSSLSICRSLSIQFKMP